MAETNPPDGPPSHTHSAADGGPLADAPAPHWPREPGSRRRWPLLLIGASAGTATWSGWVGLGELTGFGVVHPLPGIWDDLTLNTAITLPSSVAHSRLRRPTVAPLPSIRARRPAAALSRAPWP